MGNLTDILIMVSTSIVVVYYMLTFYINGKIKKIMKKGEILSKTVMVNKNGVLCRTYCSNSTNPQPLYTDIGVEPVALIIKVNGNTLYRSRLIVRS
jgi:hypothetical protein